MIRYIKDNEDIAALIERFYDLQRKEILSEAEIELEISLKSIAKEVRKRIVSSVLSKGICNIIGKEYIASIANAIALQQIYPLLYEDLVDLAKACRFNQNYT